MKLLSVIIPVHNEEYNVGAVHTELLHVLRSLPYRFEIIYIDDGSTDGTLQALRALEQVVIIRLNRNYGQATALDAGFKAAQGDMIVSMDGDCQNDPRDIPLLLDALWSSGSDVVAGWRRERCDSRQVRILTRAGRILRRAFIDDPVHDTGCTLRVYTREAAKSLDIGGEMHRYILALLRWKGFRISEIEVRHRPRATGASKYDSSKAVRGFIDLLYIWFIHKYSQRPLHLFGYVGLASFFCGLLAAAWTVYNYVALGVHFARDVWVVVSFFFFLASILFFSFGVVIDLLIRIYLDTSPFERRYYVRETIRT